MKDKIFGFTLLELIIVIIILAVLASLALPRYFKFVDLSRSSEAIAAMTTIRYSMNRCFSIHADYNYCDEFDELDVDDPSSLAGNLKAHFDYEVTQLAPQAFLLEATRNTLNGGDGTSMILLIENSTSVTLSGTGVYSGL